MDVLALDFDGVISDSSHEVFVVGLRTYAELVPDSRLLRRPEIVAHQEFANDDLFQAFADLKPLGNRAEDFGVALLALDQQLTLPDQPAYNAFRDRQDQQWLAEFHHRFYQHRAKLRDQDLAGWIRLQRPYQQFVEILRANAGRQTLAIATAKDRQSAGLLLDDYGISDLFPDQLLLDKETGVNKTAHLQALSQRLGVSYDRITFVDDKVNHLQRVAGLGVRPVLAGWGHNSSREFALARQLGFTVATLNTAAELLFG